MERRDSGTRGSDTEVELTDHELQEPSRPTDGTDLEKQAELPSKEKEEASEASPTDPNLVTWSGPDDPENPKNWSVGKKWIATFVVSSFTFISPVASTMIAPALNQLSTDLKITSEFETQLVLSIFVLAYGIAPLFFGPLSEVFGRVRLLQLSNLIFLAWNLGCGFAQNKTEMFIFRFLSGIGGSAPLAIGGGVVSDVWPANQRGKAVGIYSLAPLLGPAVGPIAGAFVAETTSWRWVFWSTTIAAALVQLSGVFFLKETYAPTILKRKADRLRKETGNTSLHTEFESDKTLANVLSTNLVRAFRLLATQPIVQIISLYMAYIFGLFYLLLSTYPAVWQGVYGEGIGIGGLNYISLGIGSFIGAQGNALVNDRMYQRLKARNHDVGRPEFRIPPMFIGSVLIPVGLFWYGWSVHARTHWIVPNIGIVFVASGYMLCLICMQTYVIDSYTRYAASGLAAVVLLRSIAGFGFPLFAPYMYDTLGYGWGNSVLGFAAIAVGIPAPFLFWIYGEKLRSKSTYAAGGS